MPKEDTTIAAAFPPPGVSPDFAHPRDVLHTVNIVTQVVSMVLITPLVALRMFVRVYASPPFLNEDYVCMVAWALYADTIIYSLATYFTKVALLLVIARVFNDFRKTHFITIFFVVAMVFYYVPMLFLKIHVCSPISDFWTTNVQDSIPNCLDRFSIFVADTIISVITDTAVLVIPIPAVLHLRIPMRARFKVWSMLGLGGVATGASITRLVILFRTIRHSTDQTVDFYRGNQHWAHLRVPSCSQHPFQQGQAAQAASIGLQRSEYLHQEAQVPPRKPPADRDRYVRRDEEARAGQELQGDCYGGTGSCLAAVSNTYT
ncbi:hypothetical protein MCOR27_000518 [Pyricularia oryzae]|nr:hypothetical protein MCOR27_000518 [Pyricularia oryzae]KAI6375530.1 hypothetical protein MCOR31_002199 [Pyricularia oryzae]KAI6437054.1 hypothetical protein MCOR21_000788 [Pyricularia oryzae]